MIDDNELISIIVPIYNVEKYLKKCIDSILSQTYKNLEIILIDDGSTDKSGNICDEYDKKDFRIKVIHKENGGLSDARNVGLDICKGEYITFIDSDDYIEYDYIEYLYKLIKMDNYEMSICPYFIEISNKKRIDQGKGYNKQVMNTEECLEKMLCDEGFSVSACAKMYRKSLFNNIRYPISKLCEDNGTTYKLIKKCKKISYGNISKYIYVKREGSIMTGKFNIKKMDLIELTELMSKELIKEFPNLKDAIERRKIYVRFSVLRQAVNDKKIDKDIIKKLRHDILKEWKQFFTNTKINKRDKFAFFVLLFGNNFYRIVWNFYYKIKY